MNLIGESTIRARQICQSDIPAVADLLSNESKQRLFVPAVEPPQSLYRRIVSQAGAKVVFLSIVMVPVSIVLAIAFDSPGPFLIPFLLFVLGIAHLAYTLIFGETISFGRKPAVDQFIPPNARFELPPQQSAPVSDLDFKRRQTAEMVTPPSVTEPTTNLLEMDPQK